MTLPEALEVNQPSPFEGAGMTQWHQNVEVKQLFLIKKRWIPAFQVSPLAPSEVLDVNRPSPFKGAEMTRWL
ncbi:hypothetical protein QUF72_09150 [Desulfobacterales bacterium HSG2]|nr:hypothetical protein [Desulfobacterales bacterium HSG2]